MTWAGDPFPAANVLRRRLLGRGGGRRDARLRLTTEESHRPNSDRKEPVAQPLSTTMAGVQLHYCPRLQERLSSWRNRDRMRHGPGRL